ncbi:MAG TPA: outer membrane beta-barrel protein [Thermoanaerobaculia bacterium]|nr:outer membrane beta-barrel protein [Thermoanaerobaculia bacterium]
MKKSLLLLCGLLIATASQAQTQPGFELGVEAFDYGYHERVEGETVANDDGRFAGLDVGYTKKFDNAIFLRGRFALDLGSVDYTADAGETQLNDVTQGIGQLEFHAGRDFRLAHRATLSPFVGLGVRVLVDDSGGEETTNGMAGYDRTVSYRYVPIGVAAGLPLRGDTSLVVSAQYNWLISGKVESKLSDIDPSVPDVTVDLNDGSGYELSAVLRRKHVSFGPFLRSWKVDPSQSFVIDDPDGSDGIVLELFEPANRTREAGIRVSFTF